MSTGLKKFEILLDSPDHTFSPGEIIAGRVIVDLNRPKSIRGLKVRIKGKAEVSWSSSTGSGKDKKMTQFTGEEEYFRMEFYLLRQTGSSENVEIQTGNHVFPFNFCLPRNIPSSFETLHGSIRYTVKAVMDRPWKFDHETSVAFTVETPYDLSQCPNAMTAIDDEEYETFCCFSCFKKGAVKVNIFLPTSGFAIGEAIQPKININNTSTSVDVTKIKLRLQQIIKLHSRFPNSSTKTHSNIVQKVYETGPFSKKDEIVVSMQVPSLPYSNMVHCSLIDIEYKLKIIISVSGCHCHMDKKYPIVIGTKPALSVHSVQNGTMNPATMPTAPLFAVGSPTATATATMPMPMPMPMPSYGFAPGNPPYPPATQVPIGFVLPNTAQDGISIESTERPPPPYAAAIGRHAMH